MSDFAQQLVPYIPNLRRYARSLTRDPDTAEDLVHDTVVRALTREHQFAPGTSLVSWLLTIQYSLFISGVRRIRRAPDNRSLPQQETGSFIDPIERIYLREIGEGLDALRPEQRAVLMLSVLEDLSYDEMAEVTGVPVGTVRSRLSRAREHLRAHMGEDRQPRTSTPASRRPEATTQIEATI